MGKYSGTEGVEVRGDTVRIHFTWEGRRYRENFAYKATQTNINRASRAAGDIKAAIKAGIFDDEVFRQHFPRSPRVAQTGNSFFEMAQLWLDGVMVSAATRDNYRKDINRYWISPLGARAMRSIRYSELRAMVNSIPWASAKTRNNALICLRGPFKMAYDDELIERNPADRIRNQKHQQQPVDPFSQAEAETIIKYLADQHLGPYFEFMFWTGLRPSEALALHWSDVDFASGYVRIEKAQSKGRLNAKTKTAKVRDVLLNERALAALQRAKAQSFLAGKHVFVTEQGEGYVTEKSQRITFTKALKKLGVRHRPQYNCRHTYATILLMAGVNPAFVASQLGNSIIMTLTRYAKWISGAADQIEMNKLKERMVV